MIALLPGSRRAELTRHLPVLFEAARQINGRHPARFKMALPNAEMAALAQTLLPPDAPRSTSLSANWSRSCARPRSPWPAPARSPSNAPTSAFPTVALYKTSWLTYLIGRRIVQVKYLAMPNLLANESLFPEFIQGQATGPNLAQAAVALLEDPDRRRHIQSRLGEIIHTLGGSGASQRAAEILSDFLESTA